MHPDEDRAIQGTGRDADDAKDLLGRNDAGRRGFMLILSSPSGAGKTTLTRMLLQTKELDLTLSISVTTRPRRSSEVDGIHYTFITRKQFEALRDGGELLEWAEVHGNCYGTPREPVEKVLAQGRDVLFDIDYQGTQQVKQKTAEDVVTIFILPPSMKELRARLERRAEDPPEVIAKRLENARNEIRRWTQYDYVLVNRDLQTTFSDLFAILTAERRRAVRLKAGIGAFVEELLRES
ncbi:guanylate kinase [Methylocella tundrae]|uniref:Guanylate kinase n=2 Tax=Methylocella tundrae TaxID=227605 RepID=A0A8B6MB31_METTU|nr:guanylate kinase [Methylocella tundrae]VTZ51489.1 guanylate kinase [Methylocella tundrae]